MQLSGISSFQWDVRLLASVFIVALLRLYPHGPGSPQGDLSGSAVLRSFARRATATPATSSLGDTAAGAQQQARGDYAAAGRN